jgi:hypothetical protein
VYPNSQAIDFLCSTFDKSIPSDSSTPLNYGIMNLKEKFFCLFMYISPTVAVTESVEVLPGVPTVRHLQTLLI